METEDKQNDSIVAPMGDATYVFQRPEPCDECRKQSDGIRLRNTMSGTYSYPLCYDCLEEEGVSASGDGFIEWGQQ